MLFFDKRQKGDWTWEGDETLPHNIHVSTTRNKQRLYLFLEDLRDGVELSSKVFAEGVSLGLDRTQWSPQAKDSKGKRQLRLVRLYRHCESLRQATRDLCPLGQVLQSSDFLNAFSRMQGAGRRIGNRANTSAVDRMKAVADQSYAGMRNYWPWLKIDVGRESGGNLEAKTLFGCNASEEAWKCLLGDDVAPVPRSRELPTWDAYKTNYSAKHLSNALNGMAQAAER